MVLLLSRESFIKKNKIYPVIRLDNVHMPIKNTHSYALFSAIDYSPIYVTLVDAARGRENLLVSKFQTVGYFVCNISPYGCNEYIHSICLHKPDCAQIISLYADSEDTLEKVGIENGSEIEVTRIKKEYTIQNNVGSQKEDDMEEAIKLSLEAYKNESNEAPPHNHLNNITDTIKKQYEKCYSNSIQNSKLEPIELGFLPLKMLYKKLNAFKKRIQRESKIKKSI